MDICDIRDLFSQIQTGARVSTAIGEPVQMGERMIIPVAEVAYGGGGGGGGGTTPAQETTIEGRGVGGGGGVRVRPLGCWVIDPAGERWIPAIDVNRAILVGGTIITLAVITLRTIVLNRR